MLLDVESEESAVMSGMRDAAGVLVDSVKRSRWALSSVGETREMRENGRGVAREDRLF